MRDYLLKAVAMVIFTGVTLCSLSAGAEVQKIAAVVNEDPITIQEFQSRKKMIARFNGVTSMDARQEKAINDAALNSLIEEQLLFQQAKKFKMTISDKEISNAIGDIEKRNKLASGHISSDFAAQGIDIATLRSKVRFDLLKTKLSGQVLAHNVSISPEEIDAAVLDTNSKDASLSLEVITAIDNSDKSYKQMISMAKKLPKCKMIKPNSYKGFASFASVDAKLSTLEPQLQTVVKDMTPGDHSDVIKIGNELKIIALCEKKIENFSNDETNYVINFLGNKKLSLKSRKYMDDLRKKAYVKIFMKL